MLHELAFLHTSAVHIPTFEALVQELAPGLKMHHHVDASLLAAAQQLGVADAGVINDIQAAMQAAAASGARIVVCTCSSIGGVAERMSGMAGWQAVRIDRAMADRAVTLGPRILLVAALETTLLPTTELLQESATALNKPVAISNLWVEDAWGFFQQGDSEAYRQSIASAVRRELQNNTAIDVVVLAQASMAAVALELQDLDKEVLSSPRLGVAHAIRLLQRM
ncbi:aspartate/glutamate racemase family protein [Undibacterium pigrum]|uniref:Asp/Glu/hydantoin racemase n=1 Tax=Undibacterium pigrum TaxID=401470 RepID=A0A318J9F9_9BURK|nr:aspartate/glutamate racemase family protein [Undibacterium pigrum]PXX43147.1 hypothetical protein DFR42_104148 [Undibacterium pigrum]